MTMDYFILDIETCPQDLTKYDSLDEDGQKKLLNPIDSKIVAIGIRHAGISNILMKDDEKEMLQEFWREWKSIHEKNTNIKIVGFNIDVFDIPFLVVRSFIHNVEISPFTVKFVIDLRDKLNAYRPGHSRGTLKDFARAMGFSVEMDGSEVAGLCRNRDFESLRKYLEKDLEITDAMVKRMEQTKILFINRY